MPARGGHVGCRNPALPRNASPARSCSLVQNLRRRTEADPPLLFVSSLACLVRCSWGSQSVLCLSI
jgi:hypothetical protein